MALKVKVRSAEMIGKFALATLFVSILAAVVASQTVPKPEKITIKGTVVAEYNSLISCGWHVCGLSLIVRLRASRAGFQAHILGQERLQG